MSSQPPPAQEVGTWAVGAAQLRDSLDSSHHPEVEGQGLVFSRDTEATWTLGQVGPHHIRLAGEPVGLQALQCHPFDRQTSMVVLLNTIVFLVQDIAGQAKVSHLDRE